MAHASWCIVREAHSDPDCRDDRGQSEPVRQRIELALELADTRQQVMALARNPGLTGISPTRGAKALDDVIEDIVRAVARKVVPAGENLEYARFLAIARGEQ